jgi:REP element-mobilizing transposase RayT
VGQAASLPFSGSYTNSMAGELEISKRRLPHWTLEGSTYFITWRLARGVSPLNQAERDVVVESLLHFKDERYKLLAYVVMDDHVHVVARPTGEHTVTKLIHSWKSYSANVINKLRGRQGALWLDECFDRLVRDEAELVQKLEYVLTNPIRRWPVAREYKWVGWFPEE